MADGKIVNTWVSDDKDMMRSIERMNKQISKLEDKLKRAGIESRKTSTRSAQGFDKQGQSIVSVTKKIAGMITGYVGVHAALRSITAELEKQKRIQLGSGQTQIELSNARAAMLRNLGAVDDKIRRESFGRIGKIAKTSHVPEAIITDAVSQALSARGNLPREAAYQAVGAAARFLPDAPEQVALVAGSLLDLTKVTKSQNAQANLGYLASVGQAARVVTTERQATNVVPAMIGMTSFGATPRGAGALTAALTTGAGDTTGAVAGTGGINFAQQLEEAFPKLATMTDRIRYLQKNPAAAKAFYDKGSFEARTKGPIRELITDPQGAVAQTYEQTYRGINVPGAGAAGVAKSIIGGYEADPLRPVANVSRAGATAIEQLKKADPRAFGRIAQETALEAVTRNEPFFSRKGRELAFEYGQWQSGVPREEMAARTLSNKIAELQTGRGFEGQELWAGVTPEGVGQANELADLLRVLIDETKRVNAERQRQVPAVRQEQ